MKAHNSKGSDTKMAGIILQADIRKDLTVEEARNLSGLLGRIAPAALAAHGWYGYTETQTGKRVLIIRK